VSGVTRQRAHAISQREQTLIYASSLFESKFFEKNTVFLVDEWVSFDFLMPIVIFVLSLGPGQIDDGQNTFALLDD
jgi:hypothetical protein